MSTQDEDRRVLLISNDHHNTFHQTAVHPPGTTKQNGRGNSPPNRINQQCWIYNKTKAQEQTCRSDMDGPTREKDCAHPYLHQVHHMLVRISIVCHARAEAVFPDGRHICARRVKLCGHERPHVGGFSLVHTESSGCCCEGRETPTRR